VPGRGAAGFQLAPCLPSATWNSTAITTRELKAGMDEHGYYAYDAARSLN